MQSAERLRLLEHFVVFRVLVLQMTCWLNAQPRSRFFPIERKHELHTLTFYISSFHFLRAVKWKMLCECGCHQSKGEADFHYNLLIKVFESK